MAARAPGGGHFAGGMMSDLLAGAVMALGPLAVLYLFLSLLFHAFTEHEDDANG